MDVLRFQDSGRTFTCKAESSIHTPGVLWWWFGVSDDDTRYAAFRCTPGDASTSLERRIVAFYEEVLATRARPRIMRKPWNKPSTAEAEAKPVEMSASTLATTVGTVE